MTTSEDLPLFDQISNALLPLGALNSPSELQGMICGKLSGGARPSDKDWLQIVNDFMDLAAAMPDDAREQVIQLCHQTLDQLSDQGFTLSLVLPDDDTELPLRADALGQWCHGFLSGFGSSGIKGDSPMSEDVADSLRDIAAIAQIDVDEDSGESHFFEVSEYVRLAVLNIFLECGDPKKSPASTTKDTLH